MQKFGQFPKREEGKYYISDIESGYPVEVSKEQWEFYNQLLASFMPKIDPEKFGSIPIIYGTAGDMEMGEKSAELFFEHHSTTKKDGK